jgi:hypothetical protein
MKRRPGARGSPDLVMLNTGGAKGTDLKDWLGHAVTLVAQSAKESRKRFEVNMITDDQVSDEKKFMKR